MVYRSCLFITSCVVLGVLVARPCQAVQQASLDAEEIKAALQTAAPEDDGFVEQVVILVNEGAIPRSMFESTFLWARRKPTRQFQYFKYALLSRLPNHELPLTQAELTPQRVTPSGVIGGGVAVLRWLLQRINLSTGNP